MNGVELTDDARVIDVVRKKVGMVFQQFNLFPHLTVLENLTLSPIWVGKLPKKHAARLLQPPATRAQPGLLVKNPGALRAKCQ